MGGSELSRQMMGAMPGAPAGGAAGAPEDTLIGARLIAGRHGHLVGAAREHNGAETLPRQRHLEARDADWVEVEEARIEVDRRQRAARDDHRLHACTAGLPRLVVEELGGAGVDGGMCVT